MQLVRHLHLREEVQGLCPRPTVEQGVFLALQDCHDLPLGNLVNADLPHLLRVGRVWVGKAGTSPEWTEVKAVSDLPKFKSSVAENYEALSFSISVSPFMPQFFFTPTCSRGRLTFRKLK